MKKNILLKTSTTFRLLIILLIITISTISFTYGLGISPAKKTISFEPDKTVNFDFDIINSELNTFYARVSSSGEISNMIFFEKEIVSINSSNYRTLVNAMIKFPSQMKPGIHQGYIEITPMIKESDDKMFRTYISPRLPISIRVPRDGKYSEVNFVVIDVDEGTPVPMFVEFDNMGSEDIIKAGANIKIYDPDGIILADVNTKEISIKAGEFGKTSALSSLKLMRGEYQASVNAYYDEINVKFDTSFKIGEPEIRIQNFLTKKLSQDKINKIDFVTYNNWNKEVDVKGFVELHDKKEEMPDFKLLPQESSEIIAFIDTSGISEGEYDLSITLVYDNIIETHVFPVEISSFAVKSPENKLIIILAVSLVIIVIIILIITIIIRKKDKI